MVTFSIKSFLNGTKIISVNLISDLPSILSRYATLLATASEVDWYLNEVVKARIISERISLSYNSISCYIEGDIAEIGHYNDMNIEILEKINTSDLVFYLKELKIFLERYESCQIPGIIPESKLDTWVAVPKEFVKDEWWEQQKKQ